MSSAERVSGIPGGIWYCKIGNAAPTVAGADLPMREAVARAFRDVAGVEPEFIFSGWSAALTEDEQAAVDAW